MRRHARRGLEGVAEVAFRKTSEAGELAEANRLGAALLDVVDCELQLPVRERAARRPPRRREGGRDQEPNAIEAELATRQEGIEGKRAVVSGSGNVAIYTTKKLQQLGGRVIACSDSNGYVVDEDGIDPALLKEIKEVRRGRISEYAVLRGKQARYVDGGSIWSAPCDIAIPSTTQNELTGKNARTLVTNGVVAVGEGAALRQ